MNDSGFVLRALIRRDILKEEITIATQPEGEIYNNCERIKNK